MELSVIIPVYNEGDTIEEVIRRVLGSPTLPEIIVVNDGSTDGTSEILERYEDHPRVHVFSHSSNIGKGAAIRTAIAHACGDIALIQDADLEYDPGDYPVILAPFEDPAVSVVYGSRRLLRSNPVSSLRFRLGAATLTWLANLLYRTGLTDEATCFKAFRMDLLRGLPLRSMRFEFCAEVTALVARMGLRIREVPIHYHPRSRREGKKIGVRDWFAAVATLLRYRWRRA